MFLISQADCLLFRRIIDTLTDAEPKQRTEALTISTTIRTSAGADEDDAVEDDIRLPEAFTQLNVESPGNSSASTMRSLHNGSATSTTRRSRSY